MFNIQYIYSYLKNIYIYVTEEHPCVGGALKVCHKMNIWHLYKYTYNVYNLQEHLVAVKSENSKGYTP